MKVSELYKTMNMEKLDKKSSESEYWENAATFIRRVWDENIRDLSRRQVEWIENIYEELEK